MKSMVAKKAGSPFVEEERGIPQPGPHQVRASAGVIDEVGPGMTHLKPGMRVGVGW